MMGHFYDRQGNPCHFVEKKDGTSRDATLRDAKKNGWVAGFSGINSILAKPGLDAWKQNQILDAAWIIDQREYDYLRGSEMNENWKAAVKKLANERSIQARDNGLAIHDAIEYYIKQSGRIGIQEKYWKYLEPVESAINDTFSLNLSDLEAETTFASREGYGGMIDALNRSYKGSGLLLDWKTKDKEFDDSTKLAYDDHGMQLAAYRHGVGLNKAICANVFISPSAKVRIEIWEESMLQDLYEQFLLLLELWKKRNNYECSW